MGFLALRAGCALVVLFVAWTLLPGPTTTYANFNLSPSSGPPGTFVSATGDMWPPGDTVTLRWDSVVGQAVATAPVGSLGTFSTSFLVPISSPGGHSVIPVGVVGGVGQSFTFLVTGSQQQVTPTSPTFCPQCIQPTAQMPQTCGNPSASVNPNSIPQGSQTTFFAQGFAAQSTVQLQITGPGTSSQLTALASTSCTVSANIQVFPNDPTGSYTVTASGMSHSGNFTTSTPLQLSATFFVTGAITQPTFGPTVGPTSSVICPLPSASINPNRISTEQTVTVGGVGFRPGSTVRIEFEDPSGFFTFPFFAPSELGPATQTCAVGGTFSVNPTVAVGRYRMNLTGPNHLGQVVTARAEFEIVPGGSGTSIVPTVVTFPTPVPPFETPFIPPPDLTPIPPGVPPVAVDQTLQLVGGPPVPAVGQTNTYEHVARIRNVLAGPLDLRGFEISLDELLQAASQGQGLNVSFNTEFQESRIVSANANVGQASVRGSTVVWDGVLSTGQTLELRTTVDHTPTQALSLTQPIRGQTLTVQDQRGVTVAVAPPPPPQLPPSQRLVQPAPPPVDPTTGSRFFEDTGFSIVNDDIWVFYHRRGGRRTFGAPISRQFTLLGGTVQLFERGMLNVGPNGGVAPVNLLDYPFLPYDSLGDLRLPRASEGVIGASPDPGAPGFGDLSQEFVRAFAPEDFAGNRTRFYSTFLSTVLFRDAFFDGRGDPNLVPGFNLEIWGLPTSDPGHRVIGSELVVGDDGVARAVDQVDPGVVLLRFQRGVMQFTGVDGATVPVPLGAYVRAVILGSTDNAELAASASGSPLWAQYNPGVENWVDRPEALADTNLALAFEPD